MIKIPNYITQFALNCKDYGTIYVVGGFVRDSLIGKASNDIDLCGNLQIKELQPILENSKFKIVSQNKTFGTAKIQFENFIFEYTTFRLDTYTKGGKHTPSKVEFITSLYDDAKRRDFTINCIYYDILEQKLIDPVGGVCDLKNKLIKTVLNPNQTLSVDGERLLRMIKLKVNFDFEIDKATLDCAINYKDNIKELSIVVIEKFVSYFKTIPSKKQIQAKKLLSSLNALQIINQVDKL